MLTNLGGRMSGQALSRHFILLASVATLLVSSRALAQMIPLVDECEIFAKVWFPGGPTSGSGVSGAAFGHFDATVTPHREILEPCDPPPPAECVAATVDALSREISDFFPAGIEFSGDNSGGWFGPYGGNYELRAISRYRFRVDTAFDYQLFAAVTPGDWPALGQVGGHVALLGPTSDITIHYTQFGFLQVSGRLGPGEYVLEGVSSGTASELHLDGASYSAQWTVNPVTDSVIVSQPLDQHVACGGTAMFSVTPVAPPGGMAYQWMRNLTPIANSSQITGATGNTLTITNACHADSGYYSVLVTVAGSNPVISVPSRLAHLTIAMVTGVEGDPGVPARVPLLTPPSPNPFRASTAMQYTLPNPTHISVAVYNAAGARVRSLVDGVRSGTGEVTWDGRTQAGGRAPAGIYFVHVDAEDVRETRKVVLLK